jgi:2-polyprenyl-3-methyl-5-hydroxy-6-metoxy-1,4-benzoquinol methylase
MPFRRTRCPACEESATTVVKSLPYGRDPVILPPVLPDFKLEQFVVRECAACGLLFQEETLDEAETAAFYRAKLDQSLATLGSRRLRDHAHLVEDVLLARKLIGREDPLILDFGAGECTWAGTAHALGCRVVCYDLHDAIVACAANYGLKAVALDEIAPDTLDFINADQVFEHLAHPLEQLRELVPKLRRGGLIKISTPGNRRMKSKLQSTNFETLTPGEFTAQFSDLMPLQHLQLFSARSLQTMGTRAGLTVKRISPLTSLATAVLVDSGRQFNRTIRNPLKRWLARGTWQWFRRV